MLFEQPLNHHTHFRSGRIPFLPIYCPVLTQCIRQFLCNSNQFFILIEVLNCLRLRQRIIKCQFISSQSKLVSLFMSCRNLFCQIQQFFNNLFIGQHSIQIRIHSTLYNFTEFLRFYHICMTVNLHLFRNQPF